VSTITFLQNPNGTPSTAQDQLQSTLLNYFHDIFVVNNISTQSHADQIHANTYTHAQTYHQTTAKVTSSDTSTYHPQINQSDFTFTNSIPTLQELHSIIKSM